MTLNQAIPRKVLFGNPENALPEVSPDGQSLAYLAPVNGVLNVWVRGLQGAAHPVTSDTIRGIRNYFWAEGGKSIVYLQDKGGDENWHFYRTQVSTGQTTDLTPFEGISAEMVARDQ